MSSESNAVWTDACPVADLEPGRLVTWKRDEHQLVIGLTEAGEPFALDNRCPHEGYPLAQGDLKDSALTCMWHNWKFDVKNGDCTLGGEAVRHFPSRIENDSFQIDLSDPDPATLIPPLVESLLEGVMKHDNGRAIRDAVRLIHLGYPAPQICADLAADDARRAEYGTTHTLAVAADATRVFHRYENAEAAYPLAAVIDMAGESNRRMPERDRPKPAPVDASDVVAVGREFRAAVEGEDAVKAEALLLGAFDAGIDRATIEYWLYETCADHFLDFGHPLIYVVKAQELLPQVPDEYARDILAGIAFDIVYATREDTLPYWKGHADALAAIESTLPDIWAARSDVVPDGFDPVGLRDAVLDAPSSRDAVAAVHEALASNVPPIEVAKAVVGAGAHRVLRFDVEVEQDRDVAETWVWVTHRFTFASAVRNAVERFDSPDVLRLIFQAVAFIHTGRKMDEPPERRAFDRLETPASAGPDDVLAAVARRDIPAALGALRACLDGGRLAELRLRLEDLAFDDPYVRPIVVVHAIKTAFAAFEEYEALGDHPDAETALFAVVRFLASPVKERRVADAVYTSLRWVEDGVVPRKLTQ